MKLKDSKKSLKIFFMIVGLLRVFWIFSISFSSFSFDTVLTIVSIILWWIFIYISLNLWSLLKKYSDRIVKFLWINIIYSIIPIIFTILTIYNVDNLVETTYKAKLYTTISMLFWFVIFILVYLYLIKIVKKLAKEEK